MQRHAVASIKDKTIGVVATKSDRHGEWEHYGIIKPDGTLTTASHFTSTTPQQSPFAGLPHPEYDGGKLSFMYLGNHLKSKDRYIDGTEYFEPFTLSPRDRLRHLYAIGGTGTGKSTLTLRTALDDIYEGCGVMVIDPHGELIEDLLLRIPPERLQDVILLDVSDSFPISLNPFFNVPKEDHGLVASGMVDAFKAVTGYDEVNTPIFNRVIHSVSRLMLDHPSGTLLDMYYFLSNPAFMDAVLKHSQDLVIKDFWEKDYPKLPPVEKAKLVGSTLNNLDPFITDPTFRHIFGQKRSNINFKEIMDNGRILLVKLPQGQIGLLKSKLIGALILAQVHTHSMRRVSRDPFHIFIDEFAYFGTSTVQHMLSGIRKYGVSLTLVHQYANQLSTDMQSAIFGTVGTIMSLRIGLEDEALLRTQFDLQPKDKLSGLDPYTAFVRTDDTYFLDLPPVNREIFPDHPKRIRRRSRELYGRDAEQVRLKINAHIRKMP